MEFKGVKSEIPTLGNREGTSFTSSYLRCRESSLHDRRMGRNSRSRSGWFCAVKENSERTLDGSEREGGGGRSSGDPTDAEGDRLVGRLDIGLLV